MFSGISSTFELQLQKSRNTEMFIITFETVSDENNLKVHLASVSRAFDQVSSLS